MTRGLPLVLLSLLFLGAFRWQQGRSLAERVLADRAAITAAAATSGVDPELALGLVWERRVHALAPAEWPAATQAALAAFVDLRRRLGATELALLWFCGQEAVVRDALARHHGQATRAAAWVRGQPEGLPVHRVLGVGRRLARTPRA